MKSDGFLSSIFVAPKKDGGWHPVINLKALNRFIFNPHLKVENIMSLRDIIREGDFMGRLDLKDAYTMVPVESRYWRFLKFKWKKQNYEFHTLLFGLASAPRIFTKLLRPVVARLRRKGIRLLIYLDDVLIMARERKTLETFTGGNRNTLRVGIRDQHQEVNFQAVTEYRVSRVPGGLSENDTAPSTGESDQDSEDVQTHTQPTPRELAHLIGLLTSTIPAITPAPLHYRALQWTRNMALSDVSTYNQPCRLLAEAKKDLEWWIENTPHWNRQSILSPTPDIILTSDASREGWEVTHQESRTGGT